MKYFKRYLEVAPLSLAIWRSQEAQAVSKIDLKRPILDIGCGFGEFGGVFFDSFVEVGVDISSADLALAAQKKKYKKLTLVDARSLPFKDKSFSTVISISSIEHIKNVEKVFDEAFRVLKQDGQFIFTVHTKEVERLFFLPFGKIFFVNLYRRVFKHEINMEKDEWLEMAKNAGFKIERCRGTISKMQVLIFQFFLITALPSQIFRLLFKKRMLFTSYLRTEIIYHLFKWLINENNLTDANIIVVARK